MGLEFWAPIIAALVALFVAGLQIPGRDEFCLDDAWIHLSYARSLRLGDGLSYNPGDLETGFSSPLWVMALAVWPLAPDPVLPVKLLGTLLHAVTAYLVAVYACDLGRARATVERPVPVASISALAGVLAACTPVLVQGATSGMEVPLAAALIVATLIAIEREAWGGAAVLGALALWARPEALFVLGVHGVLTAVWRRQWRASAGLLGAIGALALWVVYCLVVSGFPWPNTQYVKAAAPGWSGLSYLAYQVWPNQPWIVGLGGVAMIGMTLVDDAKRKDWTCAVMVAAWFATLIAIAVSRPLHPGVLFFEARYFAIVAHLPAIPIALALAGSRRWLALAGILPVAVVTTLFLGRTSKVQQAQERSVHRLHTQPARWIAQHAPADAVVAVEGAGAQRFRSPRSMKIVDIIGLNDAAVAHAPDDAAKLCAVLERGPGYLIAPTHITAPLADAFAGRVIAEFDDPSFAQVETPHPVRVEVIEITGIRPKWRDRCSAASGS